ncbi:MAG: flagellar hook-basal body complex protein FliE [Thermoplasmata archaeon]|nr:flagellar hook-basal body complex protein FliE [Thermoplasmata archaeon]
MCQLKILVTTGMPGSGKEEFLTCCQARGAKVVRMGDVVRAKAKEFGLDSSDQSVGNLATEERKRYGKDVWAKRTIPFVGGDLVVIDGARGMEEIRAFKNAFGEDLKIVAIHASPKVRFERLKARARPDSPAKLSDFETRDRRELDWGLGEVIALSDHMVDNSSTLEDLRREVDRMLDMVLGKR